MLALWLLSLLWACASAQPTNTSDGAVLFAVTSGSSCAETLPCVSFVGQPPVPTTPAGPFFNLNAYPVQHQFWTQKISYSGNFVNNIDLTIIYNFGFVETLETRFNTLVSSFVGVPVEWFILKPGEVPIGFSGDYRYSSLPSICASTVISSDDGLWGAKPRQFGVVDGDGGSATGFWGHGNFNSGDGSCSNFWENGQVVASNSGGGSLLFLGITDDIDFAAISVAPSEEPSQTPTFGPTITVAPSSAPSAVPSSSPTISLAPSAAPSQIPSVDPSTSFAPTFESGLMAFVTGSSCAETLQCTEGRIKGLIPEVGTDAAFFDADFLSAVHRSFIQYTSYSGQFDDIDLIIEYQFETNKTVDRRFTDAVNVVEPVLWTIRKPKDPLFAPLQIEGRWQFSNNAFGGSLNGLGTTICTEFGGTVNGQTVFDFSNDDGAWGASTGLINGNGGRPFDFWGHGNFNSGDGACSSFYENGAFVAGNSAGASWIFLDEPAVFGTRNPSTVPSIAPTSSPTLSSPPTMQPSELPSPMPTPVASANPTSIPSVSFSPTVATELFAFTTGSSCAETLRCASDRTGEVPASSSEEGAFFDTTKLDAVHRTFTQLISYSGSIYDIDLIINYEFQTVAKTVSERFNDAVFGGEPTRWVVEFPKAPGQSTVVLNGVWRFSNGAGVICDSATASNDDGLWGGANGVVDGNTGSRGPSFFGHGNLNDADASSCPLFYEFGIPVFTSSTAASWMFLGFIGDIFSLPPSPEVSEMPTPNPSDVISESPSEAPITPSTAPSASPSDVASEVPSASPTKSPTPLPSGSPSTVVPSAMPSDVASATPTVGSVAPTAPPTEVDSEIPSAAPTSGPPSAPPSSTLAPSTMPSSTPPSGAPSESPTPGPTPEASSMPSPLASTNPSAFPTQQPSGAPSGAPTCPAGTYGGFCEPLLFILSSAPPDGPDVGGTPVRLTVDNLPDTFATLTCAFGTVEVNATVISATVIECLSPPTAADGGLTTLEVTVVADGEPSFNSVSYSFFGACPPSACVNGFCSFGRCICLFGFEGESCDIPLVAPVIEAIPTLSIFEGDFYSYPAVLTQGSTPVTWQVLFGPPGLTIGETTGIIEWASTEAALNPHVVSIRVRNGFDEDRLTFSIIVRPTFYATVTTSFVRAPRPAPLISFDVDVLDIFTNAPVVGVFAQVWIEDVNTGARRTLIGFSNVLGQFRASYRPFSNDAGSFVFGAEATTFRNGTAQGSFGIHGIIVNPSTFTIRGNPREPIFLNETYSLSARGDIPLTNIQASILSNPLILLNVSVGSQNLAPLESTFVSIEGEILEALSGDLPLTVTSAEGVLEFATLAFDIRDRAADLRASPSSISVNVPLNNRPVFRDVTITNRGDGAPGQLQIFLPRGQTNVRTSSSSALPSIEPGNSTSITLEFSAGALALGDVVSGSIGISSVNASVTLPFRVTAVSTRVGNLTVVTQDESTYFADGEPPLTDVLVVLESVSTGRRFQQTSGSDGIAEFANLVEDYYELTATKSGHQAFRRTVLVDPEGVTILAFLSREVVSYTWTVEEVAITETVEIVVQATFETFVPQPVIVWEPTAINLDALRLERPTEINVIVSNFGLIAAEADVVFPDKIQEFYFQKPAEQPGLIAANSSVIWPVKVFIAGGINREGSSEVRNPDKPEDIILLKEATATDGSMRVSEIEVAVGGDFSAPVKMEVEEDGTVSRFFIEGEGGLMFTYDADQEITGSVFFNDTSRRRLSDEQTRGPGLLDQSLTNLINLPREMSGDPEQIVRSLQALEDSAGLSNIRSQEVSRLLSADRKLLSRDCIDDILCVVCRELINFVCEKVVVGRVCREVKRVKNVGGILTEVLEMVCEDIIETICDFVKEKACFTCDDDLTIQFCATWICGGFEVTICTEVTVYPIDGCEFNLPPSRGIAPRGRSSCGRSCGGGTVTTNSVPFTIDCEFVGITITSSGGRRLEGAEVVNDDTMQLVEESRRRLFTGCNQECSLEDARTVMQAFDDRQAEFAEFASRLNECASQAALLGEKTLFPCLVRATLPVLDLFELMDEVIQCELDAGETCVDAAARSNQPALANLLIQAERVQDLLLFAQLPYGSLVFDLADTVVGFVGAPQGGLPDLPTFVDTVTAVTGESSAGSEFITPADLASLQALNVTLPPEPTLAGFAGRWNRSLGYFAEAITTVSDLPPGANPDFFDLDATSAILGSYVSAANDIDLEGFLSITDAWSSAIKAQQREEAQRRSGVCASVRIQITQELTLTRIGFEGTLEIVNDGTSPLTDIQVTIRITPSDDPTNTATDLFVIGEPSLSGLTGVDGNGTLAAESSGSGTWLIIPLTEAAPVVETGYDVGGTLRYKIDGTEIVSVLAADTITVRPDPQLFITYFWQRDVFADDPFTPVIEPSIPFYLAVLIENRGFGTAFDLGLASSQPEIIENDKGLLVAFEIIGSRVNDEPRSPSLTLDFGDIDPRSTTQGVWELVSTLRGVFTNFTATYEYSGPIDDQRLSLIEDVTIYELTHLVRLVDDHPAAQLPAFPYDGVYFDDGLVDFLANLRPDIDFLPDTLFTSDNGTRINIRSILDVATVDASSTDPITGVTTVVVSMNYSEVVFSLEEWVYIRFDDPVTPGLFLQTVYRPDLDYYLLVDENAWQTAWTEYLLDGPELQNYIHLFDLFPAAQYVLTFGPVRPVTGLIVTAVTNETVALSWDPVVEATNYRVRIRRPGEPETAFVIVAPSLPSTEFIIAGLAPGRTYICNVQAGASTSAFEPLGASAEATTVGASTCGNGVVDDIEEECDNGDQNGIDGACTEECTIITAAPSASPTDLASSPPSNAPTTSAAPTVEISAAPSPAPVPRETSAPTPALSGSPSAAPSPLPTPAVSAEPSSSPEVVDTRQPTASAPTVPAPTRSTTGAPSVGPSPVSEPSFPPVSFDSRAPTPGIPDSAIPSLTPTMQTALSESPSSSPATSNPPTSSELCQAGILDKTETICCAPGCSECSGCGCKESPDCCPRLIGELDIPCLLSTDIVCVIGEYFFNPTFGSDLVCP